MSGAKCLDPLKSMLNILIVVHDRKMFMHDDAPCHKSKLGKTTYRKIVNVLNWPRNGLELNPVENLWQGMKTKMAD